MGHELIDGSLAAGLVGALTVIVKLLRNRNARNHNPGPGAAERLQLVKTLQTTLDRIEATMSRIEAKSQSAEFWELKLHDIFWESNEAALKPVLQQLTEIRTGIDRLVSLSTRRREEFR